ncbi:MAG: TatD family hydrolase [Candidatus Saccharimonas sp.]
MRLIDTHCHIHDSEFYPEIREEVYEQSIDANVTMLCVGTDIRSSREAVEFCDMHEQSYAIVGIHPHDAKDADVTEIRTLVNEYLRGVKREKRRTIVGIGEIGLDYFYDHSPREWQIEALREQLAIAKEFDLPVSFHVRDAFSDFWPIFDDFPGIRGVLHSFTDSQENCDEAIRRGLYIGVNGISTFTKSTEQQGLFATLPLENILLETDAPFLTPVPFRGKVNIPAYVGRVAEHQAGLKGCSVADVARITTDNATKLFGIIL